MIQLPSNILPSAIALAKLAEFQLEVNQAGDYASQVAAGKRLFKAKNKKRNPIFRVIKIALTKMCSGARRCAYCEDSVGDQVEHIFPKDFYPNLVFIWENYLYVCGYCNRLKSNRFEIFALESLAVIDLMANPPGEIPVGEPLLINPRKESGLDFLMMDLVDTFMFNPLSNLEPMRRARAERTIEILHLNDRDFLQEARRNSYENYKSRLHRFVRSKVEGAPQSKLDKMIQGIRHENHPSVWLEMKRYFQNGWLPTFDQELHDLFLAAMPDDVYGW